MAIEQDRGRDSRWLTRDNLAVFVTATGHRIAAAGCHDVRGIILMNYIAPAHHLQGLSSAMLAHLERSMREAGIIEARLVSTATAQEFYEGRGWQAYSNAIPCAG